MERFFQAGGGPMLSRRPRCCIFPPNSARVVVANSVLSACFVSFQKSCIGQGTASPQSGRSRMHRSKKSSPSKVFTMSIRKILSGDFASMMPPLGPRYDSRMLFWVSSWKILVRKWNEMPNSSATSRMLTKLAQSFCETMYINARRP